MVLFVPKNKAWFNQFTKISIFSAILYLNFLNLMHARYILIGLINLILTIVVLFLGLRLILRLFAADPGTPFVSWLYATSEPLISPFQGMFPSPTIDQGMVLEFSTIFAIFIYVLLAWLLTELVRFISNSTKAGRRRRTPPEEYREDFRDRDL
jgi:uncharacterized protein YggT (Ycf19 family)